MSSIILVHGSWHDESGWASTAALLREKGHAVSTPRLPPNDRLALPLGQVTLGTYVDEIAHLASAQKKPVVLVGHSMAGAIVSNVTERLPDRVAAVIYVAAFLLESGQSIADFVQANNRGGGRGAAAHAVFSADRTSSTIPEEAAISLFYNTCPETVAADAARKLRPQPSLPRLGKVMTTPERFGRVPRAYFSTLQDQTIFPSLQATMLDRVPCERVVLFDTDHSPFLSARGKLARAINAVAADIARGARPCKS